MSTPSPIHQLDPNLAQTQADHGLTWHDLRSVGIEGQGWTDTEHPYDRLPARAKGIVRGAIWDLTQYSAGLRARFVTDATSIAVRWTLRNERLAINLMAATGCSGVDLYAHDGQRWRFAGVGQPKALVSEVTVVTHMLPITRQFMIHLPLYNGVESVHIGLPRESHFTPAPPYCPADPRPICFYGTSINMGGCASRPGMCHIAILGRLLNRSVLNLGYAGNAKCEPELANFIGELDPSVFVIDPLSNMQPALVLERLPVFIKTLRDARPRTPILLIGCIDYTNGWLNQARGEAGRAKTQAMLKVHHQLLDSGMNDLHYLPGDALLGDDNEATVDGAHPTDAGFLRMAQAMEPAIRQLLRAPA